MPIRINENMPVIQKLREERIFVMPERHAAHQDIRELNIAIINIMPEKESTELQLLRLLSNSPLQIKVAFIRLDSHTYKNVSEEYLTSFYHSFSEIRDRYFDGLIITGAPVENLPFEAVDYWNELSEIMSWTDTHVTSTMYLCWAAQAGLYFHHGINKYRFEKKLSGIYLHEKIGNADLTRGFDDRFYAPHSRYTGVRTEDIRGRRALEILAESPVAGAYIVYEPEKRNVFINGHPEYSTETLANEYFRDLKKGLSPAVPHGYFPDDDPQKAPTATWRAHSNLLFSNWLNYCVYQQTPYNPYEKTEGYYI